MGYARFKKFQHPVPRCSLVDEDCMKADKQLRVMKKRTVHTKHHSTLEKDDRTHR